MPRHLNIDPELLQILLYPVKELEMLRVSRPVAQQTAVRLVTGVTPLLGVNNSALDIEVR